MHPPAIVRALGGRAWTYAMLSMAGLGLTALFGILVDSGWSLVDSLAGASLGGLGILASGIAVKHQHTRRLHAP